MKTHNTVNRHIHTHTVCMCSVITFAVGCQIMHNTLTQWKWFNTICTISFTAPSHAACPPCLYYVPPGHQELNKWKVGLLVSVYCMCVHVFHELLSFACACACEYLFVISALSAVRVTNTYMDPPQISISLIIALFSLPLPLTLLASLHPSLPAIYVTAGKHQLQFVWAAPWSEYGWSVTGRPPLGGLLRVSEQFKEHRC